MIAKTVAALLAASLVASARAETRPIDTARSTLTVRVGKTGVFSTFGDNHVVRAPIVAGTVDDGSVPSVTLRVDARKMTVLDPDLKPEKRAEVQTRMLGPDVLDVARFPEIRFRSTEVKPEGTGRWRVSGVLELHGKTAPISFDVTAGNGRVKGTASVSQRAYGIEPVSVAGGTVKVKDEVAVDIEVVTEGTAR